MNENKTSVTLETIVSLCKRRGFVYQTADIYGGLNGVYDFGPLGVLVKRNIKQAWLRSLRNDLGDIVELDGSLLGPESVWVASGHVEGFHDPMVDCKSCKRRYKADDTDLKKACPTCGKTDWTDIRNFNMMFSTQLGAMESDSTKSYLRPETAQSVFINFKNVLNTCRVKIPFGIAQIGKAFRNEITPKQFLFRMREFEQMELEFFCHPDNSDKVFEFWIKKRQEFYKELGVKQENLRIEKHLPDALAHYSTACSDVEYKYGFGWKELEGIAHRGNFDLTQHSKHSGKDLNAFDDAKKESYVPHVIESSVGVDRLFLTLLMDAYSQDVVEGEERIVLKLAPQIAPYKVAVMPLMKKIGEPARKLYNDCLDAGIMAQFDESGSIGKRYRRQDEIGTPFCITYDFESETDHCVTVRNRDTTKQERMALDKVIPWLKEQI